MLGELELCSWDVVLFSETMGCWGTTVQSHAMHYWISELTVYRKFVCFSKPGEDEGDLFWKITSVQEDCDRKTFTYSVCVFPVRFFSLCRWSAGSQMRARSHSMIQPSTIEKLRQCFAKMHSNKCAWRCSKKEARFYGKPVFESDTPAGRRIVFYSSLFDFILSYSVIFYSIPFCSILFCSVRLYVILFCSFFCSSLDSILFYSVLFCSLLLYSILF